MQGMGLGGFSPMNPGNTMQAKREMEQMAVQQNRLNTALAQKVVERLANESKISKMIKDSNNLSKEEVTILQAKLQANKDITQEMMKQYQTRNKVLNDTLSGVGGMGGGTGGGPGAGSASGGGGSFGKIISQAASVLAAGSAMFKYFGIDQAITRERALGGATSGTVGREMGSVYSGQAPFESAFLGEKARAAQIAIQTGERQRILNGMMLGVAGGAVGGGLAGGGLLGGAAGVGVAGGILATGGRGYLAASGASGAIAEELKRQLPDFIGRPMANFFESISKSTGNTYESIIAEQVAKTYTDTENSIRQQNPLKTLVSQNYQQNYMGNLRTQRQLGLGYQGYHGAGGYIDQIIGAGFTPEMGQNMSSQILGSGGSTRAARGAGASLGLQMERAFGFSGGASMGQVSGAIGSPMGSSSAMIKILAEGLRQGFGDEFTEENKKFVEKISQIIFRSGAGEGDVGRISAGFGDFLTSKTTRGIEAAGGAYEKFQQLGSQTSGLGGAISAVGMSRDPQLSKLPTEIQAYLMQLQPDQLHENDQFVIDAASMAGISPKELIERKKKISMNAAVPLGDVQGLIKRGKSGGPGAIGARAKAAALVGIQTRSDLPGTESFISGISGGTMPQGDFTSQVTGRLAQKETGRIEDRTVQDLAQNSSIIIKNFRAMKDEIVPTTAALASFTAGMRELALQLASGANPAQISQALMRERVRTQPTPNKPK